MKRNWIRSSVHNTGRSLDIVRIAVALILITHPIHAMFHPGDIRGFGNFLASRKFPASETLAWAVMLLQTASSLLLLVRRLVVPAGIAHILVLGMGIILVHAPRWRTVGLPDGDRQPGAEFSVLLIACLIGVLWPYWRKATETLTPVAEDGSPTRIGLEIVRIAAPLVLIFHPLGGLLQAFHDPRDMNDLGVYFSSIGYPLGIPLVWGAMFLQLVCCLALILHRFIIPACIGNMYVLCTGIWLFHAPHWFVIGPDNIIGPGHEGMEYSVLLLSCFFSLLLAYWPRQQGISTPSPYPN